MSRGRARTAHCRACTSPSPSRHTCYRTSPDERVAFLVHHPVQDGWHIDSDPKPVTVENGVAVFRAYAGPGEVVKLHVGERIEEVAAVPAAGMPPPVAQQPTYMDLANDPSLQEVNVDQELPHPRRGPFPRRQANTLTRTSSGTIASAIWRASIARRTMKSSSIAAS